MSKIADTVLSVIRDAFPSNIIVKEHYVLYNGTKLFFDYYIKDLGVLVEVQGQQHSKFIKHFHGDRSMFLKQKERDNLKLAYTQEHKELCLVRFYYNEKLTKDLIIKKIYIALDRGFCE